jgi:hypothetical protein
MPNSGIPRLQILRHRLRINHTDPLTSEFTIELTLHNDNEDSTGEVVLKEDTYRPGLRVLNSDDSELALLPNHVVRGILSGLKSKEASHLLSELNQHLAYVYWVVFPESCSIEPHGTRVIRLTWTENRQHEYPWSWGLGLFFNVPRYQIEETVPTDDEYPHFITAYPPPSHRLKVEEHEAKALGQNTSRDLTENDRYHIGAWGPMLDISVPRVENHTVHVRTVYGIYPDRNESWILAAIVIGLATLAGGFLVTMGLWAFDNPAFQNHGLISKAVRALDGSATLIGTTIVALCAGFVGLASGPVYQRAKWWAMAAGAVAALGILVASFG